MNELMRSTCVVLLGAGCATSGLGAGETKVGGVPTAPVAFEYSQLNPETGQLIAVSQDERFAGHFVQFKAPSAHGRLQPAMTADRSWVGWVVKSRAEDARALTGDGIARLEGDRGHALTCHLTFIDPPRGLIGGAHGACSRSDGELVDAAFPAVDRTQQVSAATTDAVGEH